MLDPSLLRLFFHRLLKYHERFVSLADQPLIWLLLASCIGCDNQSWPESAALTRNPFVTCRNRKISLQPWCDRDRCFKHKVKPVKSSLEVEVVPETMAVYEGVRSRWFCWWEEAAEAFKFFKGDGPADHLLNCEKSQPRLTELSRLPEQGRRDNRRKERRTHDVDCTWWTGYASRIVLHNVGGLEYSLNRTSFDIELVVAEAILPMQCHRLAFISHKGCLQLMCYRDLPFFRRKVPVCHSAISQILPEQDVDTSDHMSHHAISNNDDFLKSTQNFTYLFGREPPHVTFPGHVRSVVADATT